MTTTPLPEPHTQEDFDIPFSWYTADHLHAHAAAVTESIKQVATLNAEISMSLKDQLAAKDAELRQINADWVKCDAAYHTLRTAAQQALEALNGGDLLCELKAAQLLTAALESKWAPQNKNLGCTTTLPQQRMTRLMERK